jgi:hypothetical protein
MLGRSTVIVMAISVSCTLAGCAPRARTRPLQTTPIAAGPTTMEAARKALEGRWSLAAMTINADDGRSVTVEATGVLTSDAFGNLQVNYRLSEAGQAALTTLGITLPDAEITTAGQVVIDPQQRSITYVGEDFQKRALAFDKELAARRASPFALERTRYYVLGADGTLQLSTRYQSGKDAIVSRWKKGT